MPKELNLEQLEQELTDTFSPEQREWIARLLHDHVSGLITNFVMQVEILNKMIQRNMDINDELASLTTNVKSAASHIKGIEMTVRPSPKSE